VRQVGIHILEAQDDSIVQEASKLFPGARTVMAAISKRIKDNSCQILTIEGMNKKIQDGSIKDFSKKINNVKTILPSITKSRKEVPSKRELRKHQVAMDEQVAQIQEVNIGLTTAMANYKISQSSQYNFRRPMSQVGQAGPSGHVHLDKRGYFDPSSLTSLRDLDSTSTGLGRIQGGAGERNHREGNG